MQRYLRLLFVGLVLVTLGACKKAENSTDEESVQDSVANIAESAVASAAEQANAVTTAGGFLDSDLGSDGTGLAPNPQAACSFASARGSCTNGTISVNWGGCSIGITGATLSGTITESFASFGAASCQMNGNGSSLSRKISDSDPRKITFASGATLTEDMNPGTAWDGTTFPNADTGTVITREESTTSNGQTCSTSGLTACYNIKVQGLQKTLTGPRGRTWFDHIVAGDITAVGRKSSGNLVVTGTGTVWHQIAQYKAVHTFGSVTWGSSSCCYPTSGSIGTALTGSVTGSASTFFSSTCGEATYYGTDGSSTAITLTQCNP